MSPDFNLSYVVTSATSRLSRQPKDEWLIFDSRRSKTWHTCGSAVGPNSAVNKHASTATPNVACESIRCIVARSSGSSSPHACAKTLRATLVLHSIANVAFLPRSPLNKRDIIHSETSKLLLPVSASIPRDPIVFDFSGRFVPRIAPNSELQTQGGLPTTRIGSGRELRTLSQFVWKKSAR